MLDIYDKNYSQLIELCPDLRELKHGDYRKSVSGGFMDLHLDVLSRTEKELRIALSHNYRQNGEFLQEAKANLALARTLLSQTRPLPIKNMWKLIIAIMLFLGLLSLGFYVIWQKQVKLSEIPTIELEEKSAEEKK